MITVSLGSWKRSGMSCCWEFARCTVDVRRICKESDRLKYLKITQYFQSKSCKSVSEPKLE